MTAPPRTSMVRSTTQTPLPFMACLLAVMAFTLLSLFSPRAQADTALIFAPLPLESEAHTVTANTPLVKLLSDLLGRDVQMQVYEDHTELNEAFQAGRVHLAELGPLPLLLLQNANIDAQVLVTFREPSGASTAHCMIAVADDGVSSLAALAALPGRITAVLSRRLSTCGYLAIGWELMQAGIPLERLQAEYVDGQDRAALAVVRAEFHIGGLKDSIVQKYSPLGLRQIAASPELPGFALIVNRNSLPESVRTALQQQLLGLEQDVLRSLGNGQHGFAPFDSLSMLWLRKMYSDMRPWLQQVEP